MTSYSVFFFFLSGLLSNLAYGGTVKRVLKSKRLVIINAGTEDGFNRKSKVCFYTKSDKRIACGLVRKARKKSSIVRISRKRIKRIKKGMTAELFGTNSNNDSYFRLLGFLSKAPVTFQKLSYLTPTSSPAETLWSPNAESLLTFGGGVDIGLDIGFPTNFGFAIHFYRPFTSDADYDLDPSYFVQINQTAQTMAFWADSFYLDWRKNGTGFHMGNGIGFESTTLLARSALLSETGFEEQIMDVTVTISVVTIRASMEYLISFGSMGLSIGTIISLPVPISDSIAAGEITEANDGRNTKHLEKLITDDHLGIFNQSLNLAPSFGINGYMGLAYFF